MLRRRNPFLPPIAQAIAYKLPLISCDRKFVFYRKQGLQLIRYGRYAHEE